MNDDLDELWAQYLRIESGSHSATALELISRICKKSDKAAHQILLGKELYRHRRLKEAEKLVLDNYSESHSFRAHSEVILGKICEAAGRQEEAERWYRKATESNPKAMRNWSYLGGFLLNSGRTEEACEVYREGLKLGTGLESEAYFNLGRGLRALGDYLCAANCFEEALRLSPNFGLARDDLEDVRLAHSLRNEFSSSA